MKVMINAVEIDKVEKRKNFPQTDSGRENLVCSRNCPTLDSVNVSNNMPSYVWNYVVYRTASSEMNVKLVNMLSHHVSE
jgi:hypothetical protein